MVSTATRSAEQARKHREQERARRVNQTFAANNIEQLPEIGQPDRRAACEKNLEKFLRLYFPHTTGLSPFGKDHKRIIKRIEQCVLKGGWFVQAIPRGFGKTTISENSAIWALLYGHRKYVVALASDQGSASRIIKSIKTELRTNDLLLEDFPEVCVPIRKADNKPLRARSLMYQGANLGMNWGADDVILPGVDGAPSASGMLSARGMTGSIRGMKEKRPIDGVQQRPDWAILDDPQTDESARSPTQVASRKDILLKTVAMLGGHQKKLAIVINATVIEAGDLVDQLLDHNISPSWQAERIKFLDRFADEHDEMWLKTYAEIRNDYDPKKPGDQFRARRAATSFYRKNRKKMDKGCVVAWKYAFDPEQEISAIQKAYNTLIDSGIEAFSSELQNEPVVRHAGEGMLSSREIAECITQYEQMQIPTTASKLTCFIDVQKNLLWYVIAAWQDDFTGWVIDYGPWPDQGRPYTTTENAHAKFERIWPNLSDEARIRTALDQFAEQFLEREYKREDGLVMTIDQALVDAQWGKMKGVVYQFCRESKSRHIVMPSHGQYLGASSKPFDQQRQKKIHGEVRGLNWIIPRPVGNDVKHVVIDTNFWKSFVHARFATANGEPGCVRLFNAKPANHRMFGDQLCAEYSVPTEGRNRKVDEWKQRPGWEDNHLLDCMVGVMVAASGHGVKLPSQDEGDNRPKAKVISLASYYGIDTRG